MARNKMAARLSTGPFKPKRSGPARRSRDDTRKPKHVEEGLPSDDEIDAFDKQKDFVSLDAAQESDSEDVEDEGLYDLENAEEDSDSQDGSEPNSDDSDAEGGSFARRERAGRQAPF